MQELPARITVDEGTYDATTPAGLDAIAVAEARDHRTIEEVYIDLGDWATARQEGHYYERARPQRAGPELASVSR